MKKRDIILIVTIVLAIGGWLVFTKKNSWITYVDSVYKFSISYRCDDSICKNRLNPTQLKIDQARHYVFIPTSDKRASIEIQGFEAKTFMQNNDDPGPGVPSPYSSIQKMTSALKLPIGSVCQIFDQPLPNVEDEHCTTVLLSGENAVQVIIPKVFGSLNQFVVFYYIYRDEDHWISINANLQNSGTPITSLKSVDPELNKQLDAVSKVLSGLKFTK